MSDFKDTVPSCLHLVCGAGRSALLACGRHCERRDSILFLDAGVLQVFRDELAGLSAGGFGLHFLSADLMANGLLETAGELGFTIVDDAGFARLLAEHDHCLSWK